MNHGTEETQNPSDIVSSIPGMSRVLAEEPDPIVEPLSNKKSVTSGGVRYYSKKDPNVKGRDGATKTIGQKLRDAGLNGAVGSGNDGGTGSKVPGKRKVQRKTARRVRDVNWKAIQDDYQSGMPVKEIAQKWKMPAGTISSQATRNCWASDKRLKEAIATAAKIAENAASSGLLRGGNSENIGRAVEMAKSAALTNKNSDPLEYQKLVAEFAMFSVQQGLTKLAPPKNWREVATADTIARRAAGLDGNQGGNAMALIRISGGSAGPIDIALNAGTEGPREPSFDVPLDSIDV